MELRVVVLLVLWSALLGVYADEVFEFYGDSHYDFGLQMGQRFRDKIQQRMQLNTKLQTLLVPFSKTPMGDELLNRYLAAHRDVFPLYVEELEGIADGSEVPFETIFIENIVEEFSNSIPPSFQRDAFPAEARHPVMKCSDIVLTGETTHVVAHNEDSGEVDVNRTAIVIAKIAHEPKFVAFTYLGDLPSGAFGFNEHGVAFTLNFVQPSEIFVGGLGRGFISRDLLMARNADDAMTIITRSGQAAGHNFQLMDARAGRLWNIEVASFGRHFVHEFKEQGSAVSAFFHANQYQRLQVAQPPYQSSLHRLRRYSELTPPTTIDEALDVLGDQEDQSWPVFHDSLSHANGDLSGWTLTTIIFDLDKEKAVSFSGNPALHRTQYDWDLVNLTVNVAGPYESLS